MKIKEHILYKLCLVSLFLIFNTVFISASGVLPDNLAISAKLDLFGAQASTPQYFLQDYKQASAKLDLDFNYKISEDLTFKFLPYIRTAYDINSKERTQTLARIWQIYLNYKLNNFDFTFGRFDFEDNSLAPFIYYGDNLLKDLALPTAADGLKHSFTSKYFDYTLLAAEEAQIIEYKKAKTLGAKIKTKPFAWLAVSGFYFYEHKKYFAENKYTASNLSLYGAGVDLLFSQDSGLSFYFAHNAGSREVTRNALTKITGCKGYAFTGELYFKTLYKTGVLKNKIGFYMFSDKDKFYSLPNKLNTGIIYGGMNYQNTFPSSPKIIYADLAFDFQKYPHLFAGLGVFIYASEKQNTTNHTYYAQEVNLTAGLKYENWGLKLSGALFEGESVFLGVNSAEKQRIKKLQLNLFYKLDI